MFEKIKRFTTENFASEREKHFLGILDVCKMYQIKPNQLDLETYVKILAPVIFEDEYTRSPLKKLYRGAPEEGTSNSGSFLGIAQIEGEDKYIFVRTWLTQEEKEEVEANKQYLLDGAALLTHDMSTPYESFGKIIAVKTVTEEEEEISFIHYEIF